MLNGAAASPGVVEGRARVVRSVDQIARRPRRRDPRVRQHLAGVGADLLEDQGDRHRRRRRDVARRDRLPRVRAARRRRHRPRDRRDPHRPDDPRRRLRRARSRCSPDGERHRDGVEHAAARRAAAAPTSRGSAARAPTSASCSRPGSRCRPASPSRPRPSRRSSTTPGCRAGSRARWRGVTAGDLDAIGARVARDQRGDALRARARRGARRGGAPHADRARLGERLAAGCGPLERASARTARTRRSPASRRPTCGCAAPSTCATRCATAGSASTARRRSATARGSAPRREPPAMGVTVQLMVDAEVSGRDVHLQPGQRRPEHGRDQRELGPRAGGRRRRGDARRLPGQQGHRRGRARARARQGRRSTCPTPAAAARSASRSPTSGASAPCLDQTALERAGRRRPARRAPLRLPPGHRVGDRPRRRRRCSSSSRGR